MKKSNVIIISAIVLIFIGLFVWGYSNKQSSVASVQGVRQSNAKSNLVVKEELYDFGTISMKNGNVQKNFEITNPTNEDILVSRIITSCMCTDAFIVLSDGRMKGPYGMPGHSGFVPMANETVKARESIIIRVVYDPNAHGPAGVGPIDRFVLLTDKSGATLQLEIKATVTP